MLSSSWQERERELKRNCNEILAPKWVPFIFARGRYCFDCVLCAFVLSFSSRKIITLGWGAQTRPHRTNPSVQTGRSDLLIVSCLLESVHPSPDKKKILSGLAWPSPEPHTPLTLYPRLEKHSHWFDRWRSKFIAQTSLRYHCQIWTKVEKWFLALFPECLNKLHHWLEGVRMIKGWYFKLWQAVQAQQRAHF